jgi:comEA protein
MLGDAGFLQMKGMGIQANRLKGLREGWRGIASSSRRETVDTPVEREPFFRSEVIDLVSLAVILALAALVGLEVLGPVRAVLALVFFTFVPGWAIVTNWTSAARFSRVALSVLLSLAVSTAAATTTLWLQIWPPFGLFFVTAAASGIAITSRLIRRRAVATSGFAEGARPLGAVEAAGQAHTGALQQAPSLAAPLAQGAQVVVPRKGEDDDRHIPPPAVAVIGGTTTSALVNVNTASNAELATLPGIGKVLAQRMSDHRTANGPFSTVDELLNVRGIGDAVLQSIRELVTL